MKKHRLPRHVVMMIEDGAPDVLFVSSDKRRAAWDKVGVRPMPEFASLKTTRNEDAATTAFRVAEEARRKAKQNARFEQLKAKVSAPKIDYNKMRWDARRNKFVPMELPATRHNGLVQAQNSDKMATTMFKMVDTRHGGKTLVNVTPAGPVIDKTNAEAVAKLNGVWDPKYAKLTPGLLVMTVKNRLKKIKNMVMP